MNIFLTTITLAFRNLFRSRSRTISTILGVAVGLLGLTLLDGFITFSLSHLQDTVVRSGTGHIQIFRSQLAQDQGDSNPIPFLFGDLSAIDKELRSIPEVDDVMPVLSFSAVVSDGDNTRSVQVTAADIEQSLRNLTKRKIVAGRDLVPGQPGRILLGSGLARLLKARPGSTIQLFALSKGGGVNTNSFTVAGLTSSEIKEVDDIAVSMSLTDAQSLMGVDSVGKLVVYLKNVGDTQTVLKRLATPPHGSVLSGMKEESWDKLNVGFQYANTMYLLILGVARFVVLIVALFSISGTLTLAVLERYREIGTLRAFGTKRPMMLLLLALEGLFLGLIGTFIGSLVADVLAQLVNGLGGMTMPAQPGMSVDKVTFFFTPRAVAVVQNGVAVLVASVLAALAPVALANRKAIAELLRSH
jgi:putative ABC transport system permease protein